MEAMELPSSPEPDMAHVHGIFQTVRMETDTLPPLVELGRKLLTKAQEGDVEGVKDLMQQGAPFTTDWLGTSPLHWACQLNHIDVAELLLKAGISRDSRNKVDRTPLHCTAQEGHVAVLKLLLSYGVDVDATDMLWMTPLHWASEYGHEECVRLLLEHGADPCAINKFDKTADQIAFDNNRLDITQLVQEYAESPLRQVRRKEAKERQKQIAASHKAALELERITKQQASRVAANPKEVREVRILKLPQMRVVSPLQTTPQVRVVSPLQTTPQVRVVSPLQTTPQMRVVTPLQTAPQMRVVSPLQTAPQMRVVSPMQTTPPKIGYESNLGFSVKKNTTVNKINNTNQLMMDTSTEKTLEMLKAHGITMLPNDEGTIVASAVQSGQKVVLTEAGKMALTLTEQPSPLTGKVIKVPPELLRGKKVIKISPQELVKMKNERRVIITTEKTLKPSIFINKPALPVAPLDKNRVEVMVKKTVVNNKPQLMSSVTVEKTAEESEVERLQRELEESRRQVRELQEQFRRKEKEVDEYKRILDLLKS